MLTFEKNQYEVKTMELGGQTITYRAWEGIHPRHHENEDGSGL